MANNRESFEKAIKKPRLFFCTMLPILLAGIHGVSVAQTELVKSAARPERGITPPGSYLISDIENISLTSGNVNISIPLASLPPIAGGKLSWDVRAVYNSKIWDVKQEEKRQEGWPAYPDYVVKVPQLDANSSGDWMVGDIYSIYYRESHEDYDWKEPTQDDPGYYEHDYVMANMWYKVFILTPDGSTHELFPLPWEGLSPFNPYHGSRPYLMGYFDGTPASRNQSMGYYSYDGSYLYAIIEANGNWKLYFPDGKRIECDDDGEHIYDTNGNYINIITTTDESGNITRHYQDGQNPNREIQLITYNEVPLHKQVKYKSVDATWMTIDLYYDSSDVEFAFKSVTYEACGVEHTEHVRNEEVIQGISVLRSIVFPQTEPVNANPPYYGGRQRYVFKYNSDDHETFYYWPCPDCHDCALERSIDASKGMGQLNVMTLPSGAEVQYSLNLDGQHLLEDAYELARDAVIQKRLKHNDITDTWDYVMTGNHALVNNPDGSTIEQKSGSHDLGLSYAYVGAGDAGLVYWTNYSEKRIVEKNWVSRAFSSDYFPAGFTEFNMVVDKEYTTLLENNLPAVTSARSFQYDFNGNLIGQTDYNWFDPALVYRDSEGRPTGVPGNAPVIRSSSTSFYNPAGEANSDNVYSKRPYGFIGHRILTAEKEATIGVSTTQCAYDGQSYGSAPTNGNLTLENRWDNVHNMYVGIHHYYDTHGNRTRTTDAIGNSMEYIYDDPLLGLVTSVIVDPQNGTGEQTSSWSYDFSTGRVKSQTDANGKTTTTDYTNQWLETVDAFARPGVVTGPPVSGGSRQVITKYSDFLGITEVSSDLLAGRIDQDPGDQLLKSRTSLDQLRRPVLTETSENGSTYVIQSKTWYFNLTNGRVTIESNPTRGTGEATDGWSRTNTDVLGRVIEVATFSGATRPPETGTNESWTGSVTTSYEANVTTVTDQAGKSRRSIADAAGRIIQVIEDPDDSAYQTTYSYDVLDNLTGVLQGGQTRTFGYDSLGRLTSALNPESGTVTYHYDKNGNLETKTDNRGTISYTYDGMNRLETRAYTDETPSVTYTYDQNLQTSPADPDANNPIGRLTRVSSSVSSTVYRYDAMGRVQASMQTTDATSFRFLYEYNLAGGMKKQTYPSGRVVDNGYDPAGRVSTVSSGSTSYASNIHYAAHGAVDRLQLGNGLVEQTCFNGRLQPEVIRLRLSVALLCSQAFDSNDKLHLSYSYGDAGSNNGNVISQTISLPGLSLSQNYDGYDELNRLSSFQEIGGWSQTYEYDRYGNRLVTGDIPNQSQTPQSFDPDTNKITGEPWSYKDDRLVETDNLTKDGAGNVMHYNLDKLVSSFNGASYQYDGEGRRVKKTALGVTTVFVYNGLGQLAAEYGGSAEPAGTGYLTTDHLGSTRLITDQNQAIKARFDYLPFGEEIPAPVAGRTTGMGYSALDSTRQRFSGKERDAESGLDYFGARYFSGAQGRFLSVDPANAGAKIGDPQSWNGYAYSRNNPLLYTDPDGRTYRLHNDNGSKGMTLSDAQFWNYYWDSYTFTAGSNLVAGSFIMDKDLWHYEHVENVPLWLLELFHGWVSGGNYISEKIRDIEEDPFLGIGIGALMLYEGKSPSGIWSGTRKLSGVKNAFEHWKKHGGEFPNLQNAKQFVEAALEFVSNPPPGTLSKLRANGETILYNPATNTFAIKTAAGVPKTMFKPREGMAYFNRQ